MSLMILRDGTIRTSGKPCDKSQYVEIECDANADFKRTVLSPLVSVVRINDEQEVHLVVFRRDGKFKPPSTKLHCVPDGTSEEMAIAIFGRLLSYDNNRLSNGLRNTLVPIIRQLCPEHFRGKFDNDHGRFTFYVYRSLLSVYDREGNGIIRTSYYKLSRSIKDNIQ